MDVSVRMPKVTRVMLGGIIMPSVPPPATVPMAKSLRYPRETIWSTEIRPMAAAVAGEDPHSAANTVQESVVLIARPPLIFLVSRFNTE
jgi:hypothetical protein